MRTDASRPEPAAAPLSTEGYAGAVDHYTSPTRRDAVKQLWEEPDLIGLLDRALAATRPSEVLRVADVGCGTGVGLDLLRATPSRQHADAPPMRYLGVDLDDALLAVARERFAGDPDVAVVLADVRDGLPDAPHDLVVSSGVPYSHLVPEDLEQALAAIFTDARRSAAPTVVVVDVLGRYSLEWTSQWGHRRWSYRMSFFASDVDPEATDMTTHSGAELRELIHRAAASAACELDEVVCHDRSLVVGRHTSTGEYTPGLRPYRDLVNGLFDPDVEVAFDALLLDVERPAAPPEVLAFFAAFVPAWNGAVVRARDTAIGVDRGAVAGTHQPALARELHALETSMQRGLGVGHSLTALVVTRPAR